LASVTKSRNKADDSFEGEVKALKRALAESNAKLAEALAKIERLEAGKTKAVPAVERMRKMREKRKAKNGTTEFRG
jgi:prefoldin subunit 5